MASSLHQDKILILDFGSQTTQLIARRLREIGVYCEIHPFDVNEAFVEQFAPRGVILSGGPESVHVANGPTIPASVLALDCPVLGICYGMQALAKQFGGDVVSASHREFGEATLRVLDGEGLLPDATTPQSVWMSHGDRVSVLPTGFKIIAESDNCPIAAMANVEANYYGIQFHPEVSHTTDGHKILANFVLAICGCSASWLPENIIQNAVDSIRQRVGTDRVLLGLSGGVDSAVTAALIHQAIGDQLVCVFVDTGLLRHNERQEVESTFADHFGINLITVDATAAFYTALSGVADPEQKRKIIGKCFIDAFEAQAAKLTDIAWLAQGTIYPDVIESAGIQSGKSVLIKSHHNVGGLPDRLQLQLLEPLRELFKDEVRVIGLQLGLPPHLIHRHPFPGPGLGVRILGEIQAEYVQILRQADAIFIDVLQKSGWYQQVSQAFAVFLPVRSVGVIGDARQYEFVVSLRAVTTDDYMTAQWAHLPHELLAEVSNRIINEVVGISRVTYDISNKPPATIEWE